MARWVGRPIGMKAYLGVLVYEATVLCLIVEGFPALEGQVEAAPVHQRHLQLLPQLHYSRQQGLHAHNTTFSTFAAPTSPPPPTPLPPCKQLASHCMLLIAKTCSPALSCGSCVCHSI